MRLVSLLILSVLVLASCRQRTVSDNPAEPDTPGSDDANDQASGEVEPEGSAPPSIRLDEQVCDAHSDCRIIQPGDWNPRVACCYEYSCDLDYVAVSQQTWGQVREWQRANPFDCTAHLRVEGPCSSRAQPCGLRQDSPAAVCSEGLCRVSFADPWPAIDPELQRCTSALDCVAYPTNGGSFESRCCGLSCSQDWTPINRQTAGEIDRWRNYHATPCEQLMLDQTCPRLEECDSTAPAVACEGGQCALGRR